jgi:hypothetical protein
MAKVDNNILAVTNALFKDRSIWTHVTRQQKEEFFFIVNRLLSRRFPAQATALNNRYVDKAAGMDAWFAFFEGKPYPSWMWAKKQKVSEEDREIAQEHQICQADMELLRTLYPEEIKEEKSYIQKNKTKQ